MTNFVWIVISSQAYGFRSFPPIVFASEGEADDYIELRMKADELEGLMLRYDKHFAMLNDRQKRLEAREVLEERMKVRRGENVQREDERTRETKDQECDATRANSH